MQIKISLGSFNPSSPPPRRCHKPSHFADTLFLMTFLWDVAYTLQMTPFMKNSAVKIFSPSLHVPLYLLRYLYSSSFLLFQSVLYSTSSFN